MFFFFFSEDKSYQIFPLFILLHTKKKNQCFVLIAFSSLARSLSPIGSMGTLLERASLHVGGSKGADNAPLPPVTPLSRISVKRVNAQ